MATEDDTFNKLRRPPVEVMYILWMEHPVSDWYSEDAEEVFKSQGWTRDTFHKAWIEYRNKPSGD